MRVERKGKFIYEARILLPGEVMDIDLLCCKLNNLCTAINNLGQDRILNFEIGRAQIRVLGDQILIRVEADDLLACHSIKVALEGNIAELAALEDSSVLWIATRAEPFEALAEHGGLGA